MRYRWIVFALIVGALAFVAAGCGGGDDDGGAAEGSEDVTGDISIMAIWGGEEQASFQAVIDGFNELYPNVNVKYTSGGDNLAPLLSTAVEGGNPPDIAAVGQPGLMAGLRGAGRDPADRRPPRHDRRELRRVRGGRRLRSTGRSTGSCSRASNKSTIWYNVAAFEEAGVERSRDLGRAQRGGATRSRPQGSRRTRSASTSAGR